MEATVNQKSTCTPRGEKPAAIPLTPLPPESFAAPLPSQILSHTSQCHFLSHLTLKAAASSEVSPTQKALDHIKDWIQKHIPTFTDGATETGAHCNTPLYGFAMHTFLPFDIKNLTQRPTQHLSEHLHSSTQTRCFPDVAGEQRSFFMSYRTARPRFLSASITGCGVSTLEHPWLNPPLAHRLS